MKQERNLWTFIAFSGDTPEVYAKDFTSLQNFTIINQESERDRTYT
jgi:hypothetical protein